jgi:hypothetical protein
VTRPGTLEAANVRAAWAEYTDAIAGKTGKEYDEVEAWAYARLKQRLASIGAKTRRKSAT